MTNGPKAPDQPPAPQRRRREERYPFRAPLEVRCSSWQTFRRLFSANIAASGVFVPTDQVAQIGDMAQLRLQAPDETVIEMAATVRHVVSATDSRPQGLGLQIVEVVGPHREAYQRLVRTAAEMAKVRPEEAAAADTAARPTPASAGATTQSSARSQPDIMRPARTQPRPSGASTMSRAAQRSGLSGAPPVVAIDFGTSRSSVAVVVNRTVSLVRLPDGGWDIPSVVGFLEDGSATVGQNARLMLEAQPNRVIGSPKRLLGRIYNDPEIEPYLSGLAIPQGQGPSADVVVYVDQATYTIPQLCATVIYWLKGAAESYLGQPFSEVVLSSPVGFDDRRYRALEEAARIAGLRVKHFVDEPTAAALTHRFDSDFKNLVAVYDFGGGTFDFSVVDASAADVQVVATAGDTWLGGDDFDSALAEAAANDFWRQHRLELRHNLVQWQRLLFAAERAKRELSSQPETVVRVSDVARRSTGNLDLEFPVTRGSFNEICAPIIERSFETCGQALELSDIKVSELNAVYLSGGTTYIPAVREAVARFFGKVPRAVVPPERAVVTGAAIYAALLRSGAISEQRH